MALLRYNFATGAMLSIFVHVSMFGVLYYALVMKHSSVPLVTELDMSMTPIFTAPIQGRTSKPAATWSISKKKIQPAPQPEQEKIPEPETDLPPAPEGVWVPASQTSRKPQWIGNFITPDDYPLVARQEGNDGRVILQVHIDTEGRVRGVKLLQGSCQILNEVAVRKVKNGIFTPAYNEQGLPVGCEVILPIRFQLK